MRIPNSQAVHLRLRCGEASCDSGSISLAPFLAADEESSVAMVLVSQAACPRAVARFLASGVGHTARPAAAPEAHAH